jgi:hypothetical protein
VVAEAEVILHSKLVMVVLEAVVTAAPVITKLDNQQLVILAEAVAEADRLTQQAVVADQVLLFLNIQTL